jgi:PD-(D/E)XK nuclease superfamily
MATTGSDLSTLSTFFARFSELRENNRPPFADRLATFLKEFGRVRQRKYEEAVPDEETFPERVKYKITPASWTAFIDEFRPRFEADLRNGAFLNVWNVAGLGENEIRNVTVLAWLLDAKQTHGRGSAILHSFLKQLEPESKEPALSPSAWMAKYTVDTEDDPLGDSENRVDIVLQSSRALIFIEAKIGAKEGTSKNDDEKDQVARYLSIARATASAREQASYVVIYLTRPGASKPTIGISDKVVHANWTHVARAIENCVKLENSFVDHALIQFARHVRQF